MIVATRTLMLRSHDAVQPVAVHLYAPELDEGAWICRYEIAWPEALRESFAAGLDAMQAIHLALQKVGFDLYCSPHHASGLLAWGEPGEGYGFPVPKTARVGLVGLDRDFEGCAAEPNAPPPSSPPPAPRPPAARAASARGPERLP